MKRVFFSISAICILISIVVQAQIPEMRRMNPQDFPTAKSSVKNVIELDLSQAESPNNSVAPGVKIIRDVEYVERNGTTLNLIILYPENTESPLPCVVYIPGSAWMKQNIEMSVPNMSRFAARGFVIAIVEYRPSNIGKFPAQLQDAKTAVRFMKKNARQYHVDTKNVFGWGDSSGGHTSLLLGFTHGNQQLDTDIYSEFSDKVNAIIDYYGPSELTKMSDHPSLLDHSLATSPEGMLIGGSITDNFEAASKASPVYYMTKVTVPVLVAHGDRDMIVPFNQSDLVAETLENINAEYEYYCLSGAGHGSHEFWTNEMFDIVEKFIRKHSTNISF